MPLHTQPVAGKDEKAKKEKEALAKPKGKEAAKAAAKVPAAPKVKAAEGKKGKVAAKGKVEPKAAPKVKAAKGKKCKVEAKGGPVPEGEGAALAAKPKEDKPEFPKAAVPEGGVDTEGIGRVKKRRRLESGALEVQVSYNNKAIAHTWLYLDLLPAAVHDRQVADPELIENINDSGEGEISFDFLKNKLTATFKEDLSNKVIVDLDWDNEG